MPFQQTDTPLLAAMLHYVQDGVIPFHTPGHKQGKGMFPTLEKLIGKEALSLDLALIEELDDFYQPYGCIKDAQDLAAQLYGADHSFFVINGTTGGIYAMILATAGPGEKIIIPRNAHRSIIGGIILSGAIPIYIQPEIDTELGIAMGISPEAVRSMVRQHPDAKAVLIINPTYYGVATDLQKIVDIVHEHGMVALVDEAHGPHLKFSHRLPLQALDAGADICAQSSHKIIGALTQASLVHCKEGRIRVPHLKTMLQLTQSSSPNYIMLASLDVARMQMAVEGEKLIDKSIDLANWARENINHIPGLYCFGSEKIGNPGVFDLDPTKVTVTVKGLGLTGAEAEKILRHEYKVQAELSDIYNLLFMITLGDSEYEVKILVAALADLALKHAKPLRPVGEQNLMFTHHPALPKGVLSPRNAMFGKTRLMSLVDSVGMICAEIVTCYPPGIPLLCPGEEITQDMIDYCQLLQANGMHISGPEDCTLKMIKVVD